MRALSIFDAINSANHLFTKNDALESIWRNTHFGPSVRTASPDAVGFAIDARETPAAYLITANLPGVEKQALQIEVEDRTVTITASTATTEDEQQNAWVRRERYEGNLKRQFRLTQEIDAEAVTAKLENGVLQLTLPKKTAIVAKKIVVS